MLFCNETCPSPIKRRSLLLHPLNLDKSLDCFDQENNAEVALCHFQTCHISCLAASTSCFLEARQQ